MRLISVEKEELIVGHPIPFVLYDLKRNVLMDRGTMITDATHLRNIMGNNPLRELSARAEYDTTAANRPVQEAPQDEAMPNSQSEAPSMATSSYLSEAPALPEKSAEKGAGSTFSFLDMKLRVGDRIQLQLPASMGSDRYVVKLIGYLENTSVLVTPPLANGMRLPVRNGDKVVARVFTSQTAFAFDSTIERISNIPYDYLHLFYPAIVQGAIVRQAPRIKARIIASIAVGANSGEKISAVIVNISARGALISMREPLDRNTPQVTVSFRINLHGVDSHLHIKAVIRNIQIDDKDSNDPLKYHHGVQFMNLQPTENMILQSLIYQQMIEFPQNLI